MPPLDIGLRPAQAEDAGNREDRKSDPVCDTQMATSSPNPVIAERPGSMAVTFLGSHRLPNASARADGFQPSRSSTAIGLLGRRTVRRHGAYRGQLAVGEGADDCEDPCCRPSYEQLAGAAEVARYVCETMKMPNPIIGATTTIVEPYRPRARRNSVSRAVATRPGRVSLVTCGSCTKIILTDHDRNSRRRVATAQRIHQE